MRQRRPARLLPAILAGLAVCLAPVAHGFAAEKIHVVRSGESASLIARKHYGDLALGTLLLKYNNKSNSVIRAGERLRVPHCDIHTVRPGDSWSGIARKHLRRASVYPAIAALNDLSPRQPLHIGQEILIPVVLHHTLARGETIVRLAERFYGDASFARVLQTFNEIDDPRRLSVGHALEIPIVSLRLVSPPQVSTRRKGSSAPPPPARPRASKSVGSGPRAGETGRRPADNPPSRLGKELQAASEALSSGAFSRARHLLEASVTEMDAVGSHAERGELWRLLTVVYVAFDLPEDACRAYRAHDELFPEARWNSDLISPKVRQTVRRCEES